MSKYRMQLSVGLTYTLYLQLLLLVLHMLDSRKYINKNKTSIPLCEQNADHNLANVTMS